MGEPMNYDDYAKRYRQNRWAVDWIVEPLYRRVRELSPGQRVVEFGCGTGNYLFELCRRCNKPAYFGFDISEPMLAVARERADTLSSEGIERVGAGEVHLCRANADQRFPYPRDFVDLVYCVDVLHHLTRYDLMVQEAARVLRPRGALIAVTDSPEDIRRRSLNQFFPESLAIEQRRYPDLDELDRLARGVGMMVEPRQQGTGKIPLTDDFIAKLMDRCASSLRLIDKDAHARGMQRVKDAALRGEMWKSFYTVLTYHLVG